MRLTIKEANGTVYELEGSVDELARFVPTPIQFTYTYTPAVIVPPAYNPYANPYTFGDMPSTVGIGQDIYATGCSHDR